MLDDRPQRKRREEGETANDQDDADDEADEQAARGRQGAGRRRDRFLARQRARQRHRRHGRHLHDVARERDRPIGAGSAGNAAREKAQHIAEQLAGAVGLGGRDRRASSVVERTRINVQRCLKDAVERIATADPALGRYLSAAVKSGTYCSYRPV